MQHQAIKKFPHIRHFFGHFLGDFFLSFQLITHALCSILHKMIMMDEEITCVGKVNWYGIAWLCWTDDVLEKVCLCVAAALILHSSKISLDFKKCTNKGIILLW